MTTIQRYATMAVALLLLLGLAYCSGKKAGQIAEKLSANKTAIHASDSVTNLVTSRTDSAHVRSDILTDNRATIRPHVRVLHDTVTVLASNGSSNGKDNSSDSVTIVSPEIARLIQTDDSTIAAQARTIALQDTLVASLRVGISLRDTRISILESRGPSHFSRGIQVGVGYCQSATSRQPCAFVGYGVQLRLP